MILNVSKFMIKFFVVFHERSVSLAAKYMDQESSSTNYRLSSTRVESTLLVILM